MPLSYGPQPGEQRRTAAQEKVLPVLRTDIHRVPKWVVDDGALKTKNRRNAGMGEFYS